MEEKKLIIGLVGKIAAGKGTVADYLNNSHSATTYRFSTMLRDILNRLHLEINRPNLQALSENLRKTFGEDILAKVIAEDVKSDTGKLIVIDGIRRLADIKYLRELPEFKLVKIETDAQKRFQRIIARSENQDDRNKTYEDFLKDEAGEPEREIPIVMEEAKMSLNNDGSREELFAAVDELVKN